MSVKTIESGSSIWAPTRSILTDDKKEDNGLYEYDEQVFEFAGNILNSDPSKLFYTTEDDVFEEFSNSKYSEKYDDPDFSGDFDIDMDDQTSFMKIDDTMVAYYQDGITCFLSTKKYSLSYFVKKFCQKGSGSENSRSNRSSIVELLGKDVLDEMYKFLRGLKFSTVESGTYRLTYRYYQESSNDNTPENECIEYFDELCSKLGLKKDVVDGVIFDKEVVYKGNGYSIKIKLHYREYFVMVVEIEAD